MPDQAPDASPPWDAQFLTRSPIFEPLRPVGGILGRCVDWPSLDDCQRLAEAAERSPLTSSGLPLRFVPQHSKPAGFGDGYEPRVFLKGELQTRSKNWHDLFNALVWLTFPLAKAAINAHHFALQQQRQHADAPRNRGGAQDVLTLFDESGVIVACSDPSLASLLTDFRWKALFWERRHEVISEMKFFVFGHSLYEKALNPYPGMTGKGLVLTVEKDFFRKPISDQTAQIDAMLAATLGAPGALRSAKDFNPVPLLGVPGWATQNEAESWYEDTRYFRPGRSRPAG